MITSIQEGENNINSTRLAPEVIAELVRLCIRSEEIEIEERFFTPVDCEDEMIIPRALVQLLWGFHWNEKKLMWKEPPFSCEETWNDETYLEGDEDYVQRERGLEISYAFYLDESFCIGEEVYLAIGYFQSSGQPYRICISLKDEHMENPEVFMHDYVAEESSNLDSLSTFLQKLTTEETWEDEYTAINLRLFYQDEKSNKFWEIKVIGKRHEICFGKTGSEGQKKVKDFDNAQLALKEANRLVAEKKNKGYQN